ncbi:MAG TPA: RNA polymerase factor sigma-32 [Bdellovibrionota bacterium]|jgi:RNA polymerase sigma-32 factor|nr:RNA polymerase factor sigma-32 [Bdellovibrionota bacterium]
MAKKKKVEVLPPEETEEVESERDADIEPDEPDGGVVDDEKHLPVAARDLSPDVGALSPNDPLRQYLLEVQRHALISAEEERDLADRMIRDGDIEAAKKLVQSNLRLVVKIAFEYRSIYSNVMDLIQEGNIGLMKAVSKYDPQKGARLGYYAGWWIRSYILKYLIDNFRLVRVGTTQAQKKLFYHLMREKQRLEAQGVAPQPKLLAEKLHVPEKDVIEMDRRLSSSGAEMSLETPVDPGSGGKATHRDFLQDTTEAPDEALARNQLLEILSARLTDFEATLSARELQILRDRILAENPKTLQEVADVYGLTRERVRQMEVGIIRKLREFLRDDLFGNE